MLKIGIVISSTREGRFADTPAKWLTEIAGKRGSAEFEIVDLRDYPMPFFNGPPLMYAPATDPAAQSWAKKMAEFDAYVFITAEYNHSITGVLKNALDYLLTEVARKPACFVAYGGVAGARAVEHLRHILAQLSVATIRPSVHIGTVEMMGVMKDGKALADYPYLADTATAMLDDLEWWADTLKVGRK